MDRPSLARYGQLYTYGRMKGLNSKAARLYATLMWWGLHYGLEPPDIHSGRRSKSHQREMQKRWDRGDRSGLLVRPATSSPHTRGSGFDLERVPYLATYGEWVPYAGGRWGGNFRGEHAGDDVHFDTGE